MPALLRQPPGARFTDVAETLERAFVTHQPDVALTIPERERSSVYTTTRPTDRSPGFAASCSRSMSAASATGSRRRHHLARSSLDGSRFSERPPFARLRSRRTSSDCADVARADRVVSGRLRIRSCRHLAGGRGTSSSDVEPRRRGGSRGLLGFGAKPFIKLDPGDAERPVDPDGRQNAAGDQSLDVPPAQPQPFGDLVRREPHVHC